MAATGTTPAKSDDSVSEADDKYLRALGYKPEIRSNGRYYCRREALVGSRLETRVCATAEQLRMVRLNSREFLEEGQRKEVIPKGK